MVNTMNDASKARAAVPALKLLALSASSGAAIVGCSEGVRGESTETAAVC